ncbi:MAG: hypothetical protein H6563_02515 [Lewinellaceae bacterium]|nr:hypothetical protein [Lewinellaceae bacterium]
MAPQNDIVQLITQGDTARALELLLRETQSRSSDLHAQAVLISARWEQWRKAGRTGLANGEAEHNQINAAILKLAGLLPGIPSRKPAFSLKKIAIYAFGVVILLGAGLWFRQYMSGSNTAHPATESLPAAQSPETKPSSSLASSRTLQAETTTWHASVQPFGVDCLMEIRSLTLEPKDPSHNFVKITIAVKNLHEGWSPAQLTSDLFLLETRGDASKTEKDLLVIEISPGETKTADLVFTVPGDSKEWVLVVRESGGEEVRVRVW